MLEMGGTPGNSASKIRHAIRILDPALAEKIAAGEVVERPASVVKELVENALDAGARHIQVRLEDGGKSLIEVTDDGFGMGPEDLVLCAKRHATSKIRSLEELERVATLGFRGEALPSIAATADLTILSRAEGTKTAYHWKSLATDSAPQAETHGHFLGSEHGTRIQVSALFASIPARLKFLKTASAEVSQCREWIERLALARPETGFKLLSEDRVLLDLEPTDRASRVRQVLSDGDSTLPWVTHVHEDPTGRYEFHWLQGLSFPQMRKIALVVNGRVVKDRLLQPALLSAFRQHLLPGQFPAAALYAWVPHDRVDVNVHPAKTELRFLESSRVYQAVREGAQRLLESHGSPAWAGACTITGATSDTSSGFATVWAAHDSMPISPTPPPGGWNRTFEEATASRPAAIENTPPSASPLTEILAGGEYRGVFFQTYLAWEKPEELVLIDQHAAHERVRFEELRAQALRGHVESQALLIPESVGFDVEHESALKARLGWLRALGFEAELFGEGYLLFRAVPSAWGEENLRSRLKNLLERVLELKAHDATLALDEALFERLASQACRSSVRAGDRLDEIHARALARRLEACQQPWNCPHGRPTLVRIPRGRFEEWFLRRV